MMTEDRLLTTEQVAERLQVSTQTIQRWLRSETLRGVRLPGKAGYRVRESELQRFLAEREGKAAA